MPSCPNLTDRLPVSNRASDPSSSTVATAPAPSPPAVPSPPAAPSTLQHRQRLQPSPTPHTSMPTVPRPSVRRCPACIRSGLHSLPHARPLRTPLRTERCRGTRTTKKCVASLRTPGHRRQNGGKNRQKYVMSVSPAGGTLTFQRGETHTRKFFGPGQVDAAVTHCTRRQAPLKQRCTPSVRPVYGAPNLGGTRAVML